jgi:integrase
VRHGPGRGATEGAGPKNLALIRLVLTEGVWSRVVNLPQQLMQQARSQRRHAPIRAALLAQIAVAVAILTVAPVRLGNLAGIRLGENLIKPGGPGSNFWLVFPKYDVKNRVRLQFKLDEIVTDIIDEYVHDFRPALIRGSNADWLFPGRASNHKEKISFSTQIVDRIQKSTGLRVTVHQFRHAAGALILKHRPGEYELVRRTLGHKSIQTTIKFYLDLETTQASEIFTDIVRQRLDFKYNAA